MAKKKQHEVFEDPEKRVVDGEALDGRLEGVRDNLDDGHSVAGQEAGQGNGQNVAITGQSSCPPVDPRRALLLHIQQAIGSMSAHGNQVMVDDLLALFEKANIKSSQSRRIVEETQVSKIQFGPITLVTPQKHTTVNENVSFYRPPTLQERYEDGMTVNPVFEYTGMRDYPTNPVFSYNPNDMGLRPWGQPRPQMYDNHAFDRPAAGYHGMAEQRNRPFNQVRPQNMQQPYYEPNMMNPRPREPVPPLPHFQPEVQGGGQQQQYLDPQMNNRQQIMNLIQEMYGPGLRRPNRPMFRSSYPSNVDNIPLPRNFRVPEFSLFTGEEKQ